MNGTKKTFLRFSSLGLFAVTTLLSVAGCVRLGKEPNFECESDSDCSTGQRCGNDSFGDTTVKHCVEPEEARCSNDGDCASGEVCGLSSKCYVPECITDEQCGAYACNASNECETSCYGPNQCADGAFCNTSGVCEKTACGGDPETACSPYLCLESGCSKSCKTTDDCADGYTCDSYGECRGSGETFDSCEETFECQSGSACLEDEEGGDRSCQSTWSAGSPCDSGKNCGSGVCSNGFCAARECLESCTNGETCIDGICGEKQSGGLPCGSDDECTSGVCTEVCDISDCALRCIGTIGEYCDYDYECTEDLQCADSVCAEKLTDGSYCTEDYDCISGYCDLGGTSECQSFG